jgi:hypothetical protein
MRTNQNKSEAKPIPAKPADTQPPEIAPTSVSDTLAALQVNPDTGLAHAEVDAPRTRHGCKRRNRGTLFRKVQ